MPGMNGLTLQKHLTVSGINLPVIIMTGHGDVSSARDAFRNLAVDFLEKPLDNSKLLSAISEALNKQKSKLASDNELKELRKRVSALTPRELEVMHHVVSGHHNREIASTLEISPRTVEVHKARMMDKLNVTNVADLVRMNLQLDKDPR
jgi:FixJ family two-component response regulator